MGSGAAGRKGGKGKAAPGGGGSATVTPTLRDFATAVQDAADQAPQVFGTDSGKVFISDAYEVFQAMPEGKGVTLDQFKEKLIQANRAGAIAMSRLDMVEAISSQEKHKIEKSVTYPVGFQKYGGAEFHMIRIRRRK